LKKTGSTQPETDFATLLAGELAQGRQADGMLAAIKEIVPLASIDGLEKSQAAGFSPEEDKFMDEVSELLDLVDSYGAALAGKTEDQAQTSLKSVYSLLESIWGEKAGTTERRACPDWEQSGFVRHSQRIGSNGGNGKI
jgi:hypothetical protein